MTRAKLRGNRLEYLNEHHGAEQTPFSLLYGETGRTDGIDVDNEIFSLFKQNIHLKWVSLQITEDAPNLLMALSGQSFY